MFETVCVIEKYHKLHETSEGLKPKKKKKTWWITTGKAF